MDHDLSAAGYEGVGCVPHKIYTETELAELIVKNDKEAEIPEWVEVRNSVFSVLGLNSSTPIVNVDDENLKRLDEKKEHKQLKERANQAEHEHKMKYDADYAKNFREKEEIERQILLAMSKENRRIRC